MQENRFKLVKTVIKLLSSVPQILFAIENGAAQFFMYDKQKT